jgi:hypothetical protein
MKFMTWRRRIAWWLRSLAYKLDPSLAPPPDFPLPDNMDEFRNNPALLAELERRKLPPLRSK